MEVIHELLNESPQWRTIYLTQETPTSLLEIGVSQ